RPVDRLHARGVPARADRRAPRSLRDGRTAQPRTPAANHHPPYGQRADADQLRLQHRTVHRMMSRALGLLGLACLLSMGCASARELTRDLPGATFVKYTLAGADRSLRTNLDNGQSQLRAREYDTAVRSLRQAMWDVEQIDARSLRLEELVEVHEGLAEAYTGLGKTQLSEEQRALAHALTEYGRREAGAGSTDTALPRAKAIYQAAQFREAVTAFGQALVELEGVPAMEVRLKSLAEARCYLVF